MNLIDFREKLKKLQETATQDKAFWKEFQNSPHYVTARAEEDAFGVALFWLDYVPRADERTVDQLHYDSREGRMMFNGEGLHCGTVLEVLLPEDGWVSDRLEYSDWRDRNSGYTGWYLVGHPRIQVNGLWVRI